MGKMYITYRCKLCGKTLLAAPAILDATDHYAEDICRRSYESDEEVTLENGMAFPKYGIHICNGDDNVAGIAEFVGVKHETTADFMNTMNYKELLVYEITADVPDDEKEAYLHDLQSDCIQGMKQYLNNDDIELHRKEIHMTDRIGLCSLTLLPVIYPAMQGHTYRVYQDKKFIGWIKFSIEDQLPETSIRLYIGYPSYFTHNFSSEIFVH